jgi:3-hydroxy acid dehydrogenase/malonic semialdehyde reductase
MMSGEQRDRRGQVALITGASSGIGRAIALALAGRGIRLGLAARRVDRVRALAEEIAAADGEALTIACDVREIDQVQAMVQATTERFGGLDILVANAGFGYRAPVTEGDPARWQAMFDTNIYGLMLTLKYGVPHLVERGQGDVFLLGSIAGLAVADGGSAYSASKAAVLMIGEALRQEMSRKNVRVTTLAPGVVISEFQQVASYPPGLVQSWLGDTPPMQPEDIAALVLTTLDLPQHISVNLLAVRPTGQTRP